MSVQQSIVIVKYFYFNIISSFLFYIINFTINQIKYYNIKQV
jgi:hypothetical protein